MITSLTNPRVKQLVRLQREPRARREAGLFCLETERELSRARAAGFEIRELWIAPDMIDPPPEAGDAAVVEVSEPVLRKVAYRDHPRGFVAVMVDRRTALSSFDPPGPELLLVVSGLEKPGNFGAIARSAAAAGAGGVLIDRPRFDVFHPHAVRASTGAVFSLPIVSSEPGALRDWLKARETLIVAATPEAKLTHVMLRFAGPTAFVLGAEAEGLDAFWREAADLRAAIHMPGDAVDSLNVSVSAAILLFEAARQRLS